MIYPLAMNIAISQKDESISWKELEELLKESFQEHLNQGLQFSCSSMTAKEIEQRSKDCVVLVAQDKECDNRLVGIVTFKQIDEHEAEHSNLAVAPDYKHMGIATQLLNALVDLAQQRGCEFVTSDTAEKAHSSVAWHLKNGFRIIKLHSFSETNYYSYIFRKQLKPHVLWSNSLFCKIYYLFSALKCRATFKENGDSRYLMSLYIKMRN